MRKFPKSSGVYCILNTVTRKRYVGSATTSIEGRMHSHRVGLRKDEHSNPLLQNAWNKYKEAAFEFKILKYCAPADCIAAEQYYIDRYKSANRKHGYNIAPKAGSLLGLKWKSESKKKLSNVVIDYWKNLPQEERLRISNSRKGRLHSQEAKLKISNSGKGRRHTPETIEKMKKVQSLLSYTKKTPEHRAKLVAGWIKRRAKGPTQKEIDGKISAAKKNRGRKRSIEFSERMSNFWKGRPKSEECKLKISKALTGRKHSEETKLKLSKALKGRVVTAAQRQIYVAAWVKRKEKKCLLESVA